MTIPVKREHKISITVGPGEYSPEEADPHVFEHHRVTAFSNGRKEVVHDPANGPGTHEEHRNFGSDTKKMTIPIKREHKIPKTVGPGEYSPEEADPHVFEHHRVTAFSNGRKEVVHDPANGPGTHEEHRNFGSDSKQMTIPVKREHKIPKTVGPGEYSPDEADNHVFEVHRSTDFSKHGRKKVVHDPSNGPGTHEEHRNFGSDSKQMTIAEKRFHKVVKTPGPCDYSPEKAKTLIYASPCATSINKFGRKSMTIDAENGPGHCDEHRNFGYDSKGMTIGCRLG
jgi:hypothetical protein